MNAPLVVGRIEQLGEPARRFEDTFSGESVVLTTFFPKHVDPPPPWLLGEPMQLYCYVKQLDDVRKFFRRLDVQKHVMPLRDANELERLCLHGQVFVHFPDHVEPATNELTAMASAEGMFTMEIHVGEGR